MTVFLAYSEQGLYWLVVTQEPKRKYSSFSNRFRTKYFCKIDYHRRFTGFSYSENTRRRRSKSFSNYRFVTYMSYV